MLNIKEIDCSIAAQKKKLAGKLLGIAKGSCTAVMPDLSSKDIASWQMATVVERNKEFHLENPNLQCLALKIWDGKVRTE